MLARERKTATVGALAQKEMGDKVRQSEIINLSRVDKASAPANEEEPSRTGNKKLSRVKCGVSAEVVLCACVC